MALIKCRNCGHSISDKAQRCPKCGADNIADKPQSFGEASPLSEEQPTTEKQEKNDSETNIELPEKKKFPYLFLCLAVLLILGVGVGYFLYTDHQDKVSAFRLQEQQRQDSIVAVQMEVSSSIDTTMTTKPEAPTNTESLQKTPNPFTMDYYVGKTFVGEGNGGGLGCSVTIQFLSNGKCKITSDFYGAYSPEDIPTESGHYYISHGKLVLICRPYVYESDLEWKFDIKKNGEELSFDYSGNGGGSINNNYMRLNLIND